MILAYSDLTIHLSQTNRSRSNEINSTPAYFSVFSVRNNVLYVAGVRKIDRATISLID